MHLPYLAAGYAAPAGYTGPLSPWIWAFPIGILFLAIGVQLWRSRAELRASTPTNPIKGPALAGTAQVTGMTQDLASGAEWCCINLRVQIAGGEPYDVSIRQPVPTEQFCRLRGGGGTVAVQVEATNPDTVWIDFTKPIA
jgi:hypothetical protein